jgi:hypothetical protein
MITSLYRLRSSPNQTPFLHHIRLPRTPSATEGAFPTARGPSGHRLFISAFMITSKVICDDTYLPPFTLHFTRSFFLFPWSLVLGVVLVYGFLFPFSFCFSQWFQ